MADDITRTIRRFYDEVLNQGHIQVIDEIVAPTFVDHTPAQPTHADLAGLKQQVKVWRRAFPDLRVTIEEIIADDSRLAVRLKWAGTHTGDFMGMPPTGRRVEATAIDVLHAREGRITEAWHYGNDALVAALTTPA